MRHASLFSGIGGFDLAAEWMGWTNVFNCEWEDFPRKVLKHHFPNAIQYGDIRELDATEYRGRIDILTGGFPCQPYSTAGKRLGKEDERHLWPEMLRIIREVAPTYVVGENVRGLVNWSEGMVFEEVCTDLEAAGYDVQPFILPAAGVGAPHRRDRVWFVAHTNGSSNLRASRRDASTGKEERLQERNEVWITDESSGSRDASDASSASEPTKVRQRRQERERFRAEIRHNASTNGRGGDASHSLREGLQWSQDRRSARSSWQDENKQPPGCILPGWENFPTEPPICGGNDGLSRELDGITFSKWRNESIKAYGNAIVPQVALQIFKAIQETDRHD